MISVRQPLFVVLLCTALIQQIVCQPVRDESQLPVEIDSIANDTASDTANDTALTYNHPSNSNTEIGSSNPFREMQKMLAAMEQRFNGMFSQVQGQGMQSSSSIFSSSGNQEGMDNSDGGFFGSGLFASPCQQTLNENELVIKCNVTGYEPDQVKVDLNGQQLTISGKQILASENGQNSTMQFQQIIHLSDFNLEKLKSESNDGILNVTIPRIPHQDEEKTQKKEQPELA